MPELEPGLVLELEPELGPALGPVPERKLAAAAAAAAMFFNKYCVQLHK